MQEIFHEVSALLNDLYLPKVESEHICYATTSRSMPGGADQGLFD
jgi:hypothetical protein